VLSLIEKATQHWFSYFCWFCTWLLKYRIEFSCLYLPTRYYCI